MAKILRRNPNFNKAYKYIFSKNTATKVKTGQKYTYSTKNISEREVLVLTINGFLPIEAYKAMYLEMLPVIKKNKHTRILIDSREQKVTNQEALSWFKEVFIGLTEKTSRETFREPGMLKVAFVESQDIFSQAQANMINAAMAQAGLSYHYKTFGVMDEATVWLAEK